MDERLRFNEDEHNYDQFRPAYPDKLFQDIFDYSGLHSTSRVVEIGIGTGQATVPILKTGCSVTGVELGDKLSAFVSEKFKAYSNFTVRNADFLKVIMSSNTYDLVYSATAFHWLPETEAFQKTLDILKAQGTVALFWNHPFPNRKNDITNRVNRVVYEKHRSSDHDPIEFNETNCQKYMDLLKNNGFDDVQCKLYYRVRTLTSDAYICLLNTYSDHRALPITVKEDFEREMKSELDKVGGSINIYDTIDLYLGRKPD